MEFRLLGPVEAMVGGATLDLGRRRERGLLALLLLEVGRPVPVERLIELLFDERAPRNPRKSLQVDVSRLRRTLAAAENGDDVRLVRDHAGYAIHTDPQSIDVHRFTALVDTARDTDNATDRGRLLREALDLWHGTPMTDLGHGTAIAPIRARLEQGRLDAIELRVEADLETGRHGELVAELADLTARHPSSERLIAARMVALYRSGRKRDALDAYRRAADRMADALGLDPGPELRETHLAILRDDAELTDPVLPAGRAPTAVVPPAQLPADLSTFTGRDDELASLLARSRLSRQTAMVCEIDGMAGIGKTALAIHVARQLSSDYPDGQLFLDLNGFTQGVDPVETGDALDRMLRALGVSGAQIPQDVNERAAYYRSALADKRVLILLDNAASEAQVEPLLPGSPGCLTLITSRSRLAGLDQASPLSLDVLSEADAIALFTRVAGQSRLADEPPPLLEQVVELCGRLPLAIRIAAARLRTRDTWTLSYLINRLQDARHRLTELDVGRRDVAAAFQLSYQQLPEAQRRMFRLLAVHLGEDIDTYAAAALAGCTVREADRLLDGLLDVHLLQQHQPGRYRFHDLLRTYAAERAVAEATDSDRDAAITRLLDHYSYTASVAWQQHYPREQLRRPDVPRPRTEAVALRDAAAATEWLNAELANLLAVAAQAANLGRSAHVLHLSQTLRRHLQRRNRLDEAKRLHTQALDAAREIGHRNGEVHTLISLGRIEHLLGHHDGARRLYQQALDRAGEIDDRIGTVDVLIGLGRVYHVQGRFDAAADCYHRAVEVADEVGDPVGEVGGLSGLSDVDVAQGRYRQAADLTERCLAVLRATGDRVSEPSKLNGLGRIRYQLGEYDLAAEHHADARKLARQSGDRTGEIQALHGLGQIHEALGKYQAAADCFQDVLDLAREINNRNFLFEGMNGLGATLCAAGQPSQALGRQHEALSLAEDLEQPHDEARAHEGIADALRDLGRTDEAREHWQRALQIFAALEVPDADRVRDSLAALDADAEARD